MRASSIRSTLQRFGFLLSLLSLLLVAAACAPGTPEQASEEAASVDLTDALVIDVRTQPEYDAGHVEGAILIPYDVIGQRIADVTTDKQQQLVVYCRTGRRSGIARRQLMQMGYVKVEDVGGLAAARRRLEPQKTSN